jgi:hypothetical protein
MAEMQRQMAQQQLLMQQMMMNMMQEQGGKEGEPAPSPATKEQIHALLDALDLKLASGELSEAAYNRLVEKWQKRLEELG